MNTRRGALNRRVMASLYQVMGQPGWVDTVLDESLGDVVTRYLMLTVLVKLNRAAIERYGAQLHASWRRRYRPPLRVVRGRRLVPHYQPRLPWQPLKGLKPPPKAATIE